MKIVVAGGSGFIGRALCSLLCQAEHQVVVLTRRPEASPHSLGSAVASVEWNGREAGAWEHCLDGAHALVNLTGASIAEGRWTEARKRLLTDSRVIPTRLLVDAIARCSSRPHTLINASGIGYYGPTDDHTLAEHAPHGQGFLADLCMAWEREALRAESLNVRVVLLRTGMVLEQDGGALPKMLLPFRLFLGGPILPGTQWVSWIHRHDLIGLIQWLLATPTISGPVNAVAPEAVTMTQFCKALGHVLHRPSWIPVPSFMVNIALGELATLMTTGQRVVPEKVLTAGFLFGYPDLTSALTDIVSR